MPSERIPKQIVIDFATFALWPLVVMPNLPKDFFKSLCDITSEPLARLVISAHQSQKMRSAISVDVFARRLAAAPLAAGILNLLGDLADPLRGGSALIAVSFAATGVRPHSQRSPKAMVVWILSSAATGIIGDKASQEWSGLWHWLVSNSELYFSYENSNVDESRHLLDHEIPRTHSADGHKIYDIFSIFHDIFHWYA